MSEMNWALEGDSLQEQYAAAQGVLDYLPGVEKAVKQIRAPSSREGRQVHKLFRSALTNYILGAKQGRTLFKDISSGPGQRAEHETGFAKKAAKGRLAYSEHLLRSFTDSGRNEMEQVSPYMDQ